MSMVVGVGGIADRFIDFSLQQKYFIYVGHIHDPLIKDENVIKNEEIAIETALLKYPNAIFVYFSSCCIQDLKVAKTPYTLHKERVEKLIQDKPKHFFIFRLPQILGLSNEYGLINKLVDSVVNQRHFEIDKEAHENLIDVDDIHQVVSEIFRRNIYLNKIINIASPYQTSILEIVHSIEDFLGISANYSLGSNGKNCVVDILDIEMISNDLKINFNENYLKLSLKKYFSHLKSPSKILSIIVPTYNEENGIDEFYQRTKNVLVKLSPRFEHEIIFVNDFSTDKTFSKLKLLAENDSTVKLVNFSRNFGNQIGITAGIDFSSGDIAVVIDDDLQDPPEIILNLIAMWDKGYKVVYGIRPKRQGVNLLFKLTAKLYYRLIGSLSDTKIPNDTGDFRLIDRVVIEALKKIKEENRYYRGLVSWVGFPQIGVLYERDKRYAGVSTFSFKKYVNFAFNGLTSFTDKPLYFSSMAGLLITSISFTLALILIIGKMFDPSFSIRGWTSLTVIILFFGGIQLLSTGILGIYISKIYREVKGRPLYIVESTKNIEQ